MHMPELPIGDHEQMEQRITRALERTPVFTIPEDFATRMSAAAVSRESRNGLRMPGRLVLRHGFAHGLPKRSYGELAALVAATMLAIAMLAIAAHAGPGTSLFPTEVFLTSAFAALTVWMTMRRSW